MNNWLCCERMGAPGQEANSAGPLGHSVAAVEPTLSTTGRKQGCVSDAGAQGKTRHPQSPTGGVGSPQV
jgi:hypothetical protein